MIRSSIAFPLVSIPILLIASCYTGNELSAHSQMLRPEETTNDMSQLPMKFGLGTETDTDIYDNNDDLFPLPTTHLLVRATQVDAAKEDRKFNGNEVAVVLQGVGQAWVREQKKASERELDAGKKHIEGSIQQIQMKILGGWAGAKNKLTTAQLEQRYRAFEQVNGYYGRQHSAWRNEVRNRGRDIENLGMINKDMRDRMLSSFQPLPDSRRRKASQARKKATDALRRAITRERKAATLQPIDIRKKKGVTKKRAATGQKRGKSTRISKKSGRPSMLLE